MMRAPELFTSVVPTGNPVVGSICVEVGAVAAVRPAQLEPLRSSESRRNGLLLEHGRIAVLRVDLGDPHALVAVGR